MTAEISLLSEQAQKSRNQDLRTVATYCRGTIYRAPTVGGLEANLRKSWK